MCLRQTWKFALPYSARQAVLVRKVTAEEPLMLRNSRETPSAWAHRQQPGQGAVGRLITAASGAAAASHKARSRRVGGA